MRLRNRPPLPRAVQIGAYAALVALCCYVLPAPAFGHYDTPPTSLWACATAASMALVLFKEQR